MSEPTRRKITDYQPDPANANRGTERGLRLLDDSIAEVGLGRSIVVDKRGVIIGGNKTAERAVDRGFEDAIEVETDGQQLVVVKRTDLDLSDGDDRARRLAYLDNRVAELDLDWQPEQLLADLDAGVDLSGMFADHELEELLGDLMQDDAPEDPGPQLDRAAELQEKWGTERGQVWEIGRHRLMCGDSTSAEDVGRLFENRRASCLWTDPPYGVEYVGKTQDALVIENDSADDLPVLLRQALRNASDVLEEGAPFYLAHPPGALQVVFLNAVCEAGWAIHQQLVWVKDSMVLGHADYHYRHEPILYGWLPGPGRSGRGNHNGSRWYGNHDQTTVLEVARPKRSAEHPTMKPPELIVQCLRNSSQRGAIVSDLFIGSGSTAVAAQQTDRICYGMEIDSGYAAVTLQRLADMGLEPRLVG